MDLVPSNYLSFFDASSYAAGALIGTAAVALFGGGRAVAQGPTLTNAHISFHTNNEDKDHDTHVSVTVRDADGIVVLGDRGLAFYKKCF